MPQRFLIVDDSLVARMLLKTILKTTGAELEECCDGESALMRIENPPQFDLVFLDITMPGIDGIETLRRIKAGHPQLPVVMITADMQKQTITNALAAGAFDVLRKKIERDVILALLDRIFVPKAEP